MDDLEFNEELPDYLKGEDVQMIEADDLSVLAQPDSDNSSDDIA